MKMGSLNLKRWLNKRVANIASLFTALFSSNAFASSTGNLPFTSTMNVLEQAISGPFLLAASVIMIVVTCLMLAFGEWGDGFKRIISLFISM
jgi:type IV secretory pathway VirB2 component (pilin)